MMIGLLSALVVCLAPDETSRTDSVSRPHVVFVMADDLGPGDIGFSGGKLASTPNLVRMAGDGVRFTRYYSAAPICSPSRCGLITGNFPARWRLTSYLQTRAGNRACGQADFLDPRAPSLSRVCSMTPATGRPTSASGTSAAVAT
jgi:arylsulfatase A-like enzyme